MAKLTNAELWNSIRAAFPTFAGHTSKATAETFTEAGFEQLKNWDHSTLNDFFELSLRVFLNVVNISHAVDPLESQGFGEYFDQPYGGYIQRIATYSVKPISPAYKGLKDGDSPDQYVVRKPKVSERFWRQNFDYASLITMPDDFQYKQIFISEYGMSEYMAGIMQGMENGYTIQKYENKLEAIDKMLTGTVQTLQDSQHYTAALSADPTDEELKNFILAVNNCVEAMTMGPQNSAFNAMHFASTQDKNRLKLLIRPGIKNAIKVRTLAGAFNPADLSFDVDTIVVPNFGGLVPYKEAEYTTQLYPVYGTLGDVIGYADTQNADAVTVEEYDVHWKDPHADINAILADKGCIAEFRQNPYTVEPARNVRGKYTNFWASAPNNAIIFDPLYNFVTFDNN